MKNIFNEKTTAQIDAKLYRDILKHEEKVERICIIIAIVLIIIFRGWIGYWIKFGVAIPSGTTFKSINVKEEPIQIDYTKEEQVKKTFTYKSLITNSKMTIIPQAHYILQGQTVAYNHDFLFISDFFDSAALYDIGTSWGDLADKKIFKRYFSTYSQKVERTGSRRLNWSWSRNTPFSQDYIISHIAHSHIIPANRNIMAAFLKIKEWDNVKIEGELVDMKYTTSSGRTIEYHTSLSRTDTDETSRGNGACETIYVTKIQIGNLIYK